MKLHPLRTGILMKGTAGAKVILFGEYAVLSGIVIDNAMIIYLNFRRDMR